MAERTCPIALYAKLFPKGIALITDDELWTYSECDAILHDLCLHLKTLNISPQSRVAFVACKTPHVVFLFFALFRLRALACPLSCREPVDALPRLIEAVSATHHLEPEALCLYPSYDRSDGTLLESDLATCILTSGSSGQPKAACHTIGNHLYNAMGAIECLSLISTSRWLLSLPLFHVGGLSILFRIFLTGGAVVLSELPLPDALNRHSITHLSLVPTQLIRLLREEKDMGKTLSCLLLGGAPIASLLLQQAIQRGLPIVTTYGMTEMSSIVTAAKCPSSEHTGSALPFREFKLSPKNEVLVRGQTLFSGYWDPDTRICTSQHTDGWFATGDLGKLNSEGNLYILGRTDRLFISGGENIHPEEIERALCCIPGIVAAAVIPMPDPEFGERPAAFIQDETETHTLESIKEALRPLLPSFKHPIRFFAYPMNDALKVSHSHLKKHLATLINLS